MLRSPPTRSRRFAAVSALLATILATLAAVAADSGSKSGAQWPPPADTERLRVELGILGAEKPVYGNYGLDDRVDWYRIRDPLVKKNAYASVALVPAASLQATSDGAYTLEAVSLGEYYGLCKEERFTSQITGAFCSGTLVDSDVVLTAGHCVKEFSSDPEGFAVSNIRFVFGYNAMSPSDRGRSQFEPHQVYAAAELLSGKLVGNNDWAAIRLDRKVPDAIAKPVKLRKSRAVQKDRVYIIGYPDGLPLKYGSGAWVRDVSPASYFVANLDAFGGNSGSGVFLATTNEMVGVLVGGDERDYYTDPVRQCTRAYVCSNYGCAGEHVMHADMASYR